jgi:hypothetical protein
MNEPEDAVLLRARGLVRTFGPRARTALNAIDLNATRGAHPRDPRPFRVGEDDTAQHPQRPR